MSPEPCTSVYDDWSMVVCIGGLTEKVYWSYFFLFFFDGVVKVYLISNISQKIIVLLVFVVEL